MHLSYDLGIHHFNHYLKKIDTQRVVPSMDIVKNKILIEENNRVNSELT